MTPEEIAAQIVAHHLPELAVTRAAVRTVFSPLAYGSLAAASRGELGIHRRYAGHPHPHPQAQDRVDGIRGNQGEPGGAITAILKRSPSDYPSYPGRPL